MYENTFINVMIGFYIWPHMRHCGTNMVPKKPRESALFGT